MDAPLAIVFVVAGLALLAVGGEALVRSATTLAELAGVSPAVIGLTVVALGTSLPELVVSVLAAVRGEADIAIANVVGSNIFNIAGTLGLTALLLPLPVHGTAVRLEWPVMFISSFLCLLLARDGALDRLEGGFFVVSLAAFIAYTVHVARRGIDSAEARELGEQAEQRELPAGRRRITIAFGLLAVGVATLVGGGRLLVDGAVALARIAGVTERVIGLTVVAIGTGAPELATSVVAAIRKRSDVAVANIIGSNIFNVLGILGISALVRPIAVSPAIAGSDMWWMIGTSVLLLPLLHTNARLGRIEGGVLLAAYGAYLALLLMV